MGIALTITRVPLDMEQVLNLRYAISKVNFTGKAELDNILKRAQRRMDPSIPHGKKEHDEEETNVGG